MHGYSEAVKGLMLKRRMRPPHRAERDPDFRRAGHSRDHPLKMEEDLAVTGEEAVQDHVSNRIEKKKKIKKLVDIIWLVPPRSNASRQFLGHELA